MGIAQSTLTDKELSKLFKAVDVDGGGTVDASEFLKWLFDKQNGAAKSPKGSKKKSSVCMSVVVKASGRRHPLRGRQYVGPPVGGSHRTR